MVTYRMRSYPGRFHARSAHLTSLGEMRHPGAHRPVNVNMEEIVNFVFSFIDDKLSIMPGIVGHREPLYEILCSFLLFTLTVQ